MTRTFLVKADLGSAATAPRLGQTATVAIAAPRLAGVARVPLSALKEHQGGSSVWIVDPASMTAVARPVQVGGAEGNEAIVLAGLAPGDRVVTAGVHVLSAGQKVRLYADPEAPLVSASAPVRLVRAAAAAVAAAGRRRRRSPPPRRRCDERGRTAGRAGAPRPPPTAAAASTSRAGRSSIAPSRATC